MADAAADDVWYELVREWWRQQDPDALSSGTLSLTDDWLTRAAQAWLTGHRQVQRAVCTAADGVLRVRAAVVTPLGTLEATVGVAPEVVRIDPERRWVALRIVEPIAVQGGGVLGGLASLMGGSVAGLAAKALAEVPGVDLADDQCTVDLRAIPAAEAWCQRPWLGRPLCHYLQIVGCTVGTGQLTLHWRTGLDGGRD